MLEGKAIHIHDVRPIPNYTWKERNGFGGLRTMLGVPMLREGTPIGVLIM